MTKPRSPRIDLSPGRTQRLDFDSLVFMNLPGKKPEKLRLAFKLIWIAHRIFPFKYNRQGLRLEHYLQLKSQIEARLSLERKEEVEIDIPIKAIKKALEYMRKAGYLRYVPLEDLWYFSGRAVATLRKLAKKIEEDYQTTAIDRDHTDRIIHDFSYGLGDAKQTKEVH